MSRVPLAAELVKNFTVSRDEKGQTPERAIALRRFDVDPA